jgi:hypothetical protein
MDFQADLTWCDIPFKEAHKNKLSRLFLIVTEHRQGLYPLLVFLLSLCGSWHPVMLTRAIEVDLKKGDPDVWISFRIIWSARGEYHILNGKCKFYERNFIWRIWIKNLAQHRGHF